MVNDVVATCWRGSEKTVNLVCRVNLVGRGKPIKTALNLSD